MNDKNGIFDIALTARSHRNCFRWDLARRTTHEKDFLKQRCSMKAAFVFSFSRMLSFQIIPKARSTNKNKNKVSMESALLQMTK